MQFLYLADLTQKAASRVAQSKAEAVGGRANQLYENSLGRDLANKSLGIGAFGTYGNTSSNVTNSPVTAPVARKRSILERISDPLGLIVE